jgi:hypothetical protein
VVGRQVALLGALLLPGAAFAGGFVTQAFPTPLRVERDHVRSSLLIEFEIQRYGVSLDAFSAGSLDEAEAAFRDFFAALRAGSAAKAAPLRPGDTAEQVRKLVDDFHQGFVQPLMPKVVARIAVGEGQLFIWEWPSPRGPLRRGFTVLPRPQGAARVEVVTSSRPLEALIVDVLQQELLQPQAFATLAPRGRYRYVFPLAGPGKPGAHPVAFYFDGEPLALAVLGPDRAPASLLAGPAAAAVGVFDAAYRAVADRDFEAYAGAYTEKSRDKLRAWIAGMKPAELNSFVATTSRQRQLHFLLEADPVALVFYSVGTEKRLHYEYLLKTAGGYKLTNAYFEGLQDDVLADSALFPTDVESLRKNLLTATNPR